MTNSFGINITFIGFSTYGTRCEKTCPQDLRPSAVKPVLSGHSKKDPKWVFNTSYRLMQVKRGAFCNTFDLH